ncbi:MAG: hypothetical protein KF803_17500 [Cyclobacteriaceae bacterium]|nr:hypothetical protein [Cyclobacteriaceae bacterium]
MKSVKKSIEYLRNNPNSKFWLIPIAILLIPFILYLCIFNNGLSTDSRHWADFATFMSLFVSIVSMTLLGYISFITWRTTKLFQERQLRPCIFITHSKTVDTGYGVEYTFKMNNSSSVSANNVIVRFLLNDKNRDHKEWTSWIICFSLGPNEELELGWVTHAETIQISYSDVENQNFYLYEFKDWTGEEKAITKQVYNGYIDNALNKKTKTNDGDVIFTCNIVKEKLLHFLKNRNSKGESINRIDFLKDLLKSENK